MNPIKRLVGQTAIYGLSSIIGRLLNYFLVPLYTRIFLPAEYGVVTEFYAYVAVLMVILTYGMETGFFRFASTEKEPRKVYSTALFSVITTSLFFILVCCFFSETIAGLIGYTNHTEYVIWFGIIMGLDAITAIPFAWLRQQNKPFKFAVFKLINIGTNILLNLFFLLLCKPIYEANPESFFGSIYSPEIGVGYIFISNLVASLITFLLFFADSFRLRFIIDWNLLKRMLLYSLPLVVVGLSGMINENLDRILQKHFLVVPENITASNSYIMSQIGIYGANFKIAVLMVLFIQTFRYAAEPFFFSQAKESNSREVFADVMKYFTILGLVIFLFVVLYLDFIKYFIGKSYYEGLKIVPILMLAKLFLGIVFNLSFWYKLNNKNMIGAYITIGGAIVTIVLNIVFLPVLGYIASAWTTLFCYFVMMVVSYWLAMKYYPIKYDLKRIGLYFVCAITIYVLCFIVSPANLILRVALNSLGFFAFLAIVYKFENGKKMLSVLLNRKKTKK